MDILDRYLGYEAWTFRHFLVRCREVTPAQLHQPFDIGQGSLYDIITHCIENIEAWTDLLRERPVRELPPLPDDIDVCLERFDAALATDSSSDIADRQRLPDLALNSRNGQSERRASTEASFPRSITRPPTRGN